MVRGLVDFYCNLLAEKAPELLKISKYIAVDAYFSKKAFVSAAVEGGFHVITRLRDDAVLHYAPPPKERGKMGAPKKMGDRFWAKNLENGQLPCLFRTDDQIIYGGTVYVKSLCRLISVSIAKVAQYLSIKKEERGPFSMVDIKTQYFNGLFVGRIFDVFGKFPNITKNHPALKTI